MVLETEDTIAAIATPYGRAALGTVRISGPEAVPITSRVFTGNNVREFPAYRPILGKLRAGSHEIDEALLVYFQKPHSYTTEELIEITCHGNPLILDEVLQSLVKAGARLARPGEFTYRAFLNGRIDLVQADAVNDLISADSLYQAELALQYLDGKLSGHLENLRRQFVELVSLLEGNIDFSEEQHYNFIDQSTALKRIDLLLASVQELVGSFERGKMIRDGYHVAFVGRPNVGKSSIFNNLLGQSRAIVTAIPGTTRDYLRERISLGNFIVQLVDTAGIREGSDDIEREGIERTREVVRKADLILFVLDGSAPPAEEDMLLWNEIKDKDRIIIYNKSDLPSFRKFEWNGSSGLAVSAIDGTGIPDILETIQSRVEERVRYNRNDFLISNMRHREILDSVLVSLRAARQALLEGRSEEFAMVDLARAVQKIGEITGEVTIDDIYQHIFTHFCIGK